MDSDGKHVVPSCNSSHDSNQTSSTTATGSTASTCLPFTVDKYLDVVEPTWPIVGRHILATFDHNNNSIVVYQAYNSAIANYAHTHQVFSGCSKFNENRMTWIKTNFLWMMYRSDWGRKDANQKHILAITITRDGFEEILRHASEKEKDSAVRLQWDPDHTPYGDKAYERRAIQLGLRGTILQKFLHKWIIRIDDITEFVAEQRQFVDAKRLDLLHVPYERVYTLMDDQLAKHVRLDSSVQST